ncbi:MAG: TPM domain-containing protein [Chitinophagaceae bacterium]|nr:TPM domain-containing protein [Chitinophagaceae bacterium]
MTFFPWRKKPALFSEEERLSIVQAIRDAERMTSGEVRVFVESKCRFMDPVDRAGELFFRLKMDKTDDRNGVLVYIAVKDHQLAIFGDEGIHKRVGQEFWVNEVKRMTESFMKENYAEGLRQCVIDIGQVLHQHFPYNNDTDKNELPDDIVFGK